MARGRAALSAALLLLATALVADPVELRGRDNGFVVSGEVLSFDGRYIRLGTAYGPMSFDYQAVTCTGAACPDPAGFVPALRLAGAPALADVLLPALIEAWARETGLSATRLGEPPTITYRLARSDDPILTLTLTTSSTADGFAALLANETDMVLAAREIRPDERQAARAADHGDLTEAARSRILGVTGIVPVVSMRSPYRTITPTGLAEAFGGEIATWAALGGTDEPLNLHIGGAGPGFVEAIEDSLLDGAAVSPRVTLHDSAGAMILAVADDPLALGLGDDITPGHTRTLRLSGPCGLSVAVTPATLRTEDYPFTTPYFLYLPRRRLPEIVPAFLAWLDTPAALAVARRSGIIDLGATEIPLDAQGERLANAIRQAGPDVTLTDLQRMLRRLDNHTRLSPTFRFEPGSTRLDAQSRANVRRLALALDEGTYSGRSLLLAGFSDARGPAIQNRALSLARAEAVKAQLDRLLGGRSGVNLQTAAFGEALPMACDDTESGRRVNRRVEVWLGPVTPTR